MWLTFTIMVINDDNDENIQRLSSPNCQLSNLLLSHLKTKKRKFHTVMFLLIASKKISILLTDKTKFGCTVAVLFHTLKSKVSQQI